jgi:hypothetical protein
MHWFLGNGTPGTMIAYMPNGGMYAPPASVSRALRRLSYMQATPSAVFSIRLTSCSLLVK